MPNQLKVTIGQHSDKGRKKINQDFHAVSLPEEPLLSSKGIAIALADGISSSNVSQVASKAAVSGFLEDYFCTPESWSVKTSVQRVLRATNSWLHSQTRNSPYRFDIERGYVCTFSALVIKSNTAHLFHVGDTRIYRLLNDSLEQLTEDHRLWVSSEKSYLSRALGTKEAIEIDYSRHAAEVGDIFILATDGIYEFVSDKVMIEAINRHLHDLDQAARIIRDAAFHAGSDDNLSIQIVSIVQLPHHDINELYQQATTLPFPPALKPRMLFDGYEISRKIHGSNRSHVFLATDTETKTKVIIKTPSVDLRDNPSYLERFLMEEWVARRLNSAHVLRPCPLTRERRYLYVATEFIEGQTLAQWMTDNPQPDTETVRGIIEQIAKGLRAFHRLEMLHQDLRPHNIMIDHSGTVKIIDFGSTRVAGLAELTFPPDNSEMLGTAQYSAPEYFLGESGTTRSDQFSLGVIAYQMLSGKLPYGTQVAKATSRAAQRKLHYHSVLDDNRAIPAWIDGAIKKAVHPDPHKRYDELTEFIHDLRHPNRAFTNRSRPPLIERKPILFWKSVSLFLLCIIILLLANHPELGHR